MRLVLLLTLLFGVEALAQARTVTVLIATRDLAAGTMVRVSDVEARAVPSEIVTKSVVDQASAKFIVDQPLVMPMVKGDLVLWSFFQAAQASGAWDLCWKQLGERGTAAEQIARARQRILAPMKVQRPAGGRAR